MSLRALQADFQEWLTQESSASAARLAAAAAPGAGDAAPGLAVYLNTYRGQLMACLTETFSITHAWLGDAAFKAAAAAHIDQVPPCSWTLDAYAQGFPDTLRTLYAGDAEVAELACLERALSEVFTGPDCAAVDPAGLTQTDWDQALLRPVPTFSLLPAASNAAAIWSALSEGLPPPAVRLLAAPAQVAVWRVEYTPRFRTLESGEADALSRLAAGMRFGALCALLVEQHGEEQGPALAGAWLGQWLREGLIAAVE